VNLEIFFEVTDYFVVMLCQCQKFVWVLTQFWLLKRVCCIMKAL